MECIFLVGSIVMDGLGQVHGHGKWQTALLENTIDSPERLDMHTFLDSVIGLVLDAATLVPVRLEFCRDLGHSRHGL